MDQLVNTLDGYAALVNKSHGPIKLWKLSIFTFKLFTSLINRYSVINVIYWQNEKYITKMLNVAKCILCK